MVSNIGGPLYYERMGRTGPVMAFIHPNPMDLSCWTYQMAHFSTWYRCLAIDIPGYGRSPKAKPGLTMQDMAEACWEAVDDLAAGEATVLAGCSVGSALIPYMYHLRPESSAAVILTGTGYNPDYPSVAARRTESYRNEGIGFRWRYTFEDFSPAFRTQPMAHYFAELFTERNNSCDVDSIIHQFEALAKSDPDAVLRIGCPLLLLSGTEDTAHPRAMELKARMSEAELQVLPGAGHACQMEQPWLFDRFVLDFLKRHELFPG